MIVLQIFTNVIFFSTKPQEGDGPLPRGAQRELGGVHLLQQEGPEDQGEDMDNNDYPDLLVGAYDSGDQSLNQSS